MATTQCQSRECADMEERYQSRLNRYITAMRNEKPDMIPIRPFVAEFTGQVCRLHLPGGGARLQQGL